METRRWTLAVASWFFEIAVGVIACPPELAAMLAPADEGARPPSVKSGSVSYLGVSPLSRLPERRGRVGDDATTDVLRSVDVLITGG